MIDVYLDAAASAPLCPESLAAMQRVWQAGQANASALHSAGARARAEVEAARSTIATAFQVPPSGVIFGSGGTEANNLGIIGVALANPVARRIVTTPIEHSSVLASCAYLERMNGFAVEYLPVDREGRIAPGAEALIHPDTTLVAIGLANSEVGTVQDVSSIAAYTRAHGIHLHIDAVQAAPALPVDLGDGWPGANVDSLAVASHKFGGPQGVGALLLPREVPLEPILHGGSHEGGRRAGTENVAGIAGFAAAVAATRQNIGLKAAALMASRDQLIAAVLEEVPGARLTGHPAERLPGHASFLVSGRSGESMLVDLDAAGIAASSGSACRAHSNKPSPALLAMGFSEDEALTALRFSFSRPLSSEVIDRVLRVLKG